MKRNSLSEALRAELRGSGVIVTALCPGPVDTEFQEVASRPGRKVKPGPGPEFLQVTVEQVVRDALAALEADRPLVIPGFANEAILTSRATRPLAGRTRPVASLPLQFAFGDYFAIVFGRLRRGYGAPREKPIHLVVPARWNALSSTRCLSHDYHIFHKSARSVEGRSVSRLGHATSRLSHSISRLQRKISGFRRSTSCFRSSALRLGRSTSELHA